MPAKLEKTKQPGIYRVHSRGCPGTGCRCEPTYQAAVYVKAQNRRLRRHFRTAQEAKLWRAEAVGAVNAGKLRAVRKRTLEDAAAELLAGMRDGSIANRSGKPYKPATVRSYDRALRLRVLPALGRHELGSIELGHVQRFAEGLIREGLDASTVRNTLDPVRVIFRRALRLGDVFSDPTARLELPVGRGRRHVCVGPADALALVAALPEGERALWAVALFCGLRRGELRALRWTDVDLSRGTIRVDRTWDDDEGEVAVKSEAGHRVLTIPAYVTGILAMHGLATARVGEALVFGATSTAPFTPTTVNRRARKAWATAGLEPLTPHEARHACASFLISRPDVSDLELTRMIGHSDERTTKNIYGHLLPDSGARVAASMDAMIEAAREAS